jgi:exonuclease VII small subunit
MQEFAQRLLVQRREILSDHQTAEHEVAELAERLQQVHAPLEERLRAYEKRIAELEAELAEKGEQNLALIQARIDTTRQKLETERAQDTLNAG